MNPIFDFCLAINLRLNMQFMHNLFLHVQMIFLPFIVKIEKIVTYYFRSLYYLQFQCYDAYFPNILDLNPLGTLLDLMNVYIHPRDSLNYYDRSFERLLYLESRIPISH